MKSVIRDKRDGSICEITSPRGTRHDLEELFDWDSGLYLHSGDKNDLKEYLKDFEDWDNEDMSNYEFCNVTVVLT